MRTIIILKVLLTGILLSAILVSAWAQPFLSGLSVTAKDAIFTTYAAPMTRSDYKTDQAWELMWADPDKPVGLTSKDAGETGLIYAKGQEVRNRVSQFSAGPVITTSYSDLVSLHYYPFGSLRVDATFIVYSSNCLIQEYTFTNESSVGMAFQVFPYIADNKGFSEIQADQGRIIFSHHRNRDNWMKEHNIPFQEDFSNLFTAGNNLRSFGIYPSIPDARELLSGKLNEIRKSNQSECVLFQDNITLNAGEIKKIRIIRVLNAKEKAGNLASILENAEKADIKSILAADESQYSKIPVLTDKSEFLNIPAKDLNHLYYSSFNLLRQCMMPPEGKCRYNYYIFSREPKWGWGYGGQVFHESLSMLAYVYLDPDGAMNSQRVFMERQEPSGYINYRTGPYLDENMGNHTSSGPFFSFINLNIYQVTKDAKFLREAYESGQKLYLWFTKNRDKDNDLLLEWGGDAVLESLRDGLVDVWDNVSKPENLESPDLNSMMVQEAICLAMMAKELKLDNEYRGWLNTANRHAGAINKQLWDEETGFYYNTLLSTNGFSFLAENDLKIKDITGFLPMWANFCNKEQVQKLVQSLTNPEEFWRPYGIPTLSAKSAYYNPMGYWNGPAWIQWEYLIFRGLLDYGYYPQAIQLAQKVLDQMIWHLRNDHTFWEFYSPDQRQAGWNHTYIWAGLAARFLIDLQTLQNSSQSSPTSK